MTIFIQLLKNMEHPILHQMYHQVLLTIGELEAVPLVLPEGLALLKGELRGTPVIMTSRAWKSERFRLIRFTHLYCKDRIETFNFVLYPHDQYDAPIFASDWVLLGDKLRIAVIDAMPIFPHEAVYYKQWVNTFHDLHIKSKEIAPVFERKLSWSTKYLGESACLATNANLEGIQALAILWKAYLERYITLTSQVMPCTSERKLAIKLWHRKYNREHLEVENKRNPYMMYFGKELGERYNKEFLFSDTYGRETLQNPIEAHW